MKYYLIERYRDIPAYTEVNMLNRYAYDSGYPVCLVEYLGKTYKPDNKSIMSGSEIEDMQVRYAAEFKRINILVENTINSEK